MTTTAKLIQAKIDLLNELIHGSKLTSVIDENGNWKSIPERFTADNNSTYGGWELHEYSNTGGAVNVIPYQCGRMPAKHFATMLDSLIRFHQQSTQK